MYIGVLHIRTTRITDSLRYHVFQPKAPSSFSLRLGATIIECIYFYIACIFRLINHFKQWQHPPLLQFKLNCVKVLNKFSVQYIWHPQFLGIIINRFCNSLKSQQLGETMYDGNELTEWNIIFWSSIQLPVSIKKVALNDLSTEGLGRLIPVHFCSATRSQ